ncbi:MAG: T9SS type A sorting domain-containing protein [Bacteroidota bacterium]
MKRSFYLSSLLVFCFILGAGKVKAQAPVITTDPHDTTVCTGTPALFSFTATGATTDFMWELSTDGGASWDTVFNGGAYSGAANDTLMVTPMLAMNGYWYRGIAFNGTDADTSNAAMLGVDTLNAGIISGAQRVCVGGNVMLSQTRTGGIWTVSNARATIDAAGMVTGVSFGKDTAIYTITNACGVSVARYAFTVDTVVSALPIVGPSAACASSSSSVMLANANNLEGSWTWSSANSAVASVTSSGMVTAVSGGVTTISYSFTNACNTVVSTHTFTSHVTLTAGTVSGPTEVCAGASIALTSSVSGGSWISSATSVAVVDPTGFVTGVAQGSAVISYYRSNTCGASTATHTVNVVTTAAAITGPDSVGIGNTITLANTTTGGVWTSSNTAVDTVNAAGIVFGVATGTSLISYTVTNSCGTTWTTKTVHVGNAPVAGTIFGKDTVCVGATITLGDTTATAPGTWSVSNNRAVLIAPGIIRGDSVGRDTVYYTVANAFGTSVARKIIRVHTAKVDSIDGPAIVSVGGSYTLTGYPAGGTWTASNNTVASLIGYGFFVMLKRGRDTFTYTVTNLCGTASKQFVVELSTVGVDDVNSSTASFDVYPNPSNGAFAINLSSDNNDAAVVTVTNAIGQTVKEFTLAANKVSQVQLDQPAGVYFITAVSATGRYTSKVTIAK